MTLWKYHNTVGTWKAQRECLPENAEQWFEVFQRSEPSESFCLSLKAPKTAPDGRLLPRLVKGRYVD